MKEMRMSPRVSFRALLVAVALSLPVLSLASEGLYAVYSTSEPFDDVMENLRMAIQERGMFINNEMHMGDMLERTGKDLGFDEKIYEKAESIEFCSSVLSRKMVEEKPQRIVNCPFIISVYVLPSDPKKTHVVHRALASAEVEQSPVMAEVAAMLKSVAEAAVAW